MAIAQPRRRARWREYDDVYVGILCCLISTFLFWVVNALGKVLAVTYPIPILVFFRSLFALIMCMVLAMNMGGWGALRARRPRAVLMRGAVWFVMIACSFAKPARGAVIAGPVPETATRGRRGSPARCRAR